MKTTPVGIHEDARLATLGRYEIMDTPPERDFDELANLVSQVCGCAYAAISFVGKEKQFFKSGPANIDRESSREESFCTHTILQDEVMVVQDATKDERFADSCFVKGPLGIRFYAGAPIVAPNGQAVGSLCVFDNKPSTLTEQQRASLQIISRQVTRLLELRMINKLAEREAARKLARERSALQHTLKQQDHERQHIGVALHENFAQVLAASLMYMNIASAEAKQDPFFDKARLALTDLLHDMRKMSRTYNPLSLHVAAIEETMYDILQERAAAAGYTFDFDWSGDAEKIEPKIAENIMHILMQYLRHIEGKSGLTEVSVIVRVNDVIRLRIRDNGKWDHGHDGIDTPAALALFRRIELTNGSYEFTAGRNELAVLKIVMPLGEQTGKQQQTPR